jgi:hypothetical protein
MRPSLAERLGWIDELCRLRELEEILTDDDYRKNPEEKDRAGRRRERLYSRPELGIRKNALPSYFTYDSGLSNLDCENITKSTRGENVRHSHQPVEC